MLVPLESKIKETAHALGFKFAAIAPFKPPDRTEEFLGWLEAGKAGEMSWFHRNIEKRTNPAILWPHGQSILMLGMNYYKPYPEKLLWNDPSRGRIAMYAWGNDYHDLITPRLKHLSSAISYLAAKNIHARWYVDTGPLLEKSLAEMANMGFIGKNTLLLIPENGSFLFLAALLLDLPLEPDPPLAEGKQCGKCLGCIKSCPTGTLDTPFKHDSPRCISYLTIENKGTIPRDLRSKLGNWIYGCDECQSICPFNRRHSEKHGEEWFEPASPDRQIPSLVKMMNLSVEEFRDLFKKSAVKRIRRDRFLRNVAVALGNWGSDEAVNPLRNAMEEPSELVRSHAAWALGQIGSGGSQSVLEKQYSKEESGWVKEEISLALK